MTVGFKIIRGVSKMRKNIYMNPPLQRLLEKTEQRGFSAALGNIIERYEILLELSELPAFSDEEINILSESICGSIVDRRKIRGLHLDVLDCVGDENIKFDLSKKIEKMEIGAKLALIEKLGQQYG